MDKKYIDMKTAIQIAKIVATATEERMPIMRDIFKQAGRANITFTSKKSIDMDKKYIDMKTAIQIAKIVATVPEERMPIIRDIFKQAGFDIGGIDEMAEWKALTEQALFRLERTD